MLTNSVAIDFELLAVIDRRSYNQPTVQIASFAGIKLTLQFDAGRSIGVGCSIAFASEGWGAGWPNRLKA
jgi:hypothetical protein